MKKFSLFAVFSTFMLLAAGQMAQAQTAPIQIYNCQDLQNINNNLLGNYQLANNIDCSGVAFTPIGPGPNDSQKFQGTLDGQGHSIRNVSINISNNSEYNVGLFGVINNSQNSFAVTNVALISFNINGSSSAHSVGALAGYLEGQSIISKIIVKDGNIISQNGGSAGGIVGQTDAAGLSIGGLIEYSGVDNTYINANFGYAGGLAGLIIHGSILQSYSNATVVTQSTGGGLVGEINSGSISNSYSLSHVTGSIYLGGLVGATDSSMQIINSYAAGKVDQSNASGGIYGNNYGWMTNDINTYWDIQATGQSTAVGFNQSLSTGDFGEHTVLMQSQNTYQGWDFNNIWTIGNQGYPVLVWQEQNQINLWNTFNALNPSQMTIFENNSPPDTINWTNLSALSLTGVNWADIRVLTQPPVWNYQTTIPTAGSLNSINWNYLTSLSDTNINWSDVLVFSRMGINWDNVNPLIHSGINWADWYTSTTAGINWNSISILSKAGINWNNIGFSYGNVNWTNLAIITKQNVNWNALSILSNSNVNWNEPTVLNTIPLTGLELDTLRTVGVNPIVQAPATSTTSQVTLNLTGNASGTFTSLPAGINCTSGSTNGCTATFALNQPITLNFTSINNSAVTNWGGCVSTSTTSCTLTPDQSEMTINIAINPTYTINVTSATGGTINPSGTVTVDYEQNQFFYVTANSGYLVKGYIVDGQSFNLLRPFSQDVYEFKDVTTNHTIQPIFAPASNITVQTTGNGQGALSSSPIMTCISFSGNSSCNGSFITGSTITLTATANSVSTFTKWTGITGCSTQSSCTFTINSNMNVGAEFDLLPTTKILRIVTVGDGHGILSSSPAFTNCTLTIYNGTPSCTGEYAPNTSVTLTAKPLSGFVFNGWQYVPGCTNQNPCTFTINKNLIATARFSTKFLKNTPTTEAQDTQ